ncbi:hypothetical protein GCM10009716_35260 [Streptomyces sodiiphilus]|uniref:N-acetylmuramoyl-L-alanine amidase n=1 Tax=Streptomyces sodiiphilus TaxID=226217 RepID=A0ABP5AVQ0_9ACTN
MRSLIATALGAACAAALIIPMSLTDTGQSAAHSAHAAPRAVDVPARDTGGTQSLPLQPLSANRSGADQGAHGLPVTEVEPFSLVGVVWQDPEAELHGRVEVRTRETGSGTWSDWQELDAHDDHAPDPGTEEAAGSSMRGGTAPLWVGDADAVQVRVLPESGERAASPSSGLPEGLRVELVSPGDSPAGDPAGEGEGDPAGSPSRYPVGDTYWDAYWSEREDRPSPDGDAGGTAAQDRSAADDSDSDSDDSGEDGAGPAVVEGLGERARESSAANAGLAPLGATRIPAAGKADSEAEAAALARSEADATAAAPGGPHVGPRPGIVTRAGWGADERWRTGGFVYTDTVKTAFVHHTAMSNDYACKDVPSVLRSIYRYHTGSQGWRDVGYNFFVDRCGQIYEGRAGGVVNAVLGAHTFGFNHNSMGIAVLGTYASTEPSKEALDGVAKLTAWKLGLYGVNPQGSGKRTSAGGKYPKGTTVTLNTVSGHRDGFATECPGARLYQKLPAVRSTAHRLQGR